MFRYFQFIILATRLCLATCVFLFTISCSIENNKLDREQCESPYHRSIIWGNIPSLESFSCFVRRDYFSWPFDCDSTTEQVYDAFTSLAEEHSNYIRVSVAGQSSDGQDIMYYTFGDINNQNAPQIIIVCAQHGFEKNSTFGTLLFIEEVLSRQNDFCRYILENARLIIFPVANPYGFDNFKYCNANEVNTNRNWQVYGWKATGSAGRSDYSGIAPLDQPETKVISQVISENKDAILLLDFHTYGGNIVDNTSQINQLVIPEMIERDDYYDAIFEVADKHRERVTALFREKYSHSRHIFDENPIIGFTSKCSFFRNLGCLNNYGSQNGIISLTFEGFNGFPLDSESFTMEVAEANADLLGNFIYSFIERYSQFGK